jgi:hypothetical protein
VGGAEVLQELLVRGGLLQRVELLAVEVLHEGVTEHVVVAGIADDGRDDVQPGDLGGAQAALAHDELVVVLRVGDLAYDDRLEESHDADRLGQFLQSVLREVLARLARVRPDGFHGDLGEMGAGDRLELRAGRDARGAVAGPGRVAGVGGLGRRGGRDQRTEALAQPASLLAHSGAPRYASSEAASL